MEIAVQFDEQNQGIPTGIQRNLLFAQQAESQDDWSRKNRNAGGPTTGSDLARILLNPLAVGEDCEVAVNGRAV
jgi:hypothetical protein